jgi:hypothetical protein
MTGDDKVKCPYVGLVPYTERDARFFFGREREQRQIISNLFASRLTILYGASGVGKSSVLRAGVVRELENRIKNETAEEASEPAVIYFNEWQGDALTRLKQAIGALAVRFNNLSIPRGIGIHFDPSAPSGAAIDALPLRSVFKLVTTALNRDLFILLDQFEENFLYHPVESRSDPFALEFADAINATESPVSVLISLRDDALSKLDRFKNLIPNLFNNYIRIDHLNTKGGEEAVTEPIRAYNELPASERATGNITIEASLVRNVIEQVRTGRVSVGDVGRGAAATAGPSGIEAPYLQLVMVRIWSEELDANSTVLRASTLDRLEGAAKIVKTHLDGVLANLSDEQRRICADMFQYLVTPTGTKIAHTTEDLADFAKISVAELTPLLEQLSGTDKRILAPVAPPSDRPDVLRYEIYHDSLCRAILDWRRRYFQNKDREEQEKRHQAEAEIQRREVEQAQELAAAQRARAESETKRLEFQIQTSRRLKRWLAAVVGLSILAAGAAGYAWYERGVAKERQRVATQNEEVAKNMQLRAEAAEKQAQSDRAAAEAARADALANSLKAAGQAQEAADYFKQAKEFREQSDKFAAAAKTQTDRANSLSAASSRELSQETSRAETEKKRADTNETRAKTAETKLADAQQEIQKLNTQLDTLRRPQARIQAQTSQPPSSVATLLDPKIDVEKTTLAFPKYDTLPAVIRRIFNASNFRGSSGEQLYSALQAGSSDDGKGLATFLNVYAVSRQLGPGLDPFESTQSVVFYSGGFYSFVDLRLLSNVKNSKSFGPGMSVGAHTIAAFPLKLASVTATFNALTPRLALLFFGSDTSKDLTLDGRILMNANIVGPSGGSDSPRVIHQALVRVHLDPLYALVPIIEPAKK